MKNTIPARIAEFLKQFPPFELLDEDQILSISKEVKVLYLPKGKSVFSQGEKGHSYFYLVNKGAVILEKRENGKSETRDKCDEGDLLGLRPLFAKENYLLDAVADEESILYAIPISIFRPLVESNIKVGEFLIQSFASNTRNPYALEDKGRLYSENSSTLTGSSTMFELQPAPITRRVVSVSPKTSITEAAILMSKKRISSLLVIEKEAPVGIITNENFRDYLAGGTFDPEVGVTKIMSSPVICYPQNITIAQAQIAMMKHRINHICITRDGTPNTAVTGILSEHNIMVSEGNNPSILMKAIQRSGSTKELKKIRNKISLLLKGYMENNIPLNHVSKIMFELNDATVKRIIERCIQKMPSPPPVEFAWLSLGSQGRKEQLLQTDQDNAIVFEDVAEANTEENRSYFLELARKVTKRLNIIGFQFCPADTMASNPAWCRSLSEWKEQTKNWISHPGNDELLRSSIFLDYDISFGNVSLSNELSGHIFDLLENNRKFLSTLGIVTLRNPSPLGFFRQFLVEQNGENRDSFDLKKRAITPLTEAGRLLILAHKVRNISNTAERYEKLAQLEPQNRELYLSCAHASHVLLKFRTRQGLKYRDAGRYIKLDTLSKEEKMKLKRCFKSIREVQELIRMRFEIPSYNV